MNAIRRASLAAAIVSVVVLAAGYPASTQGAFTLASTAFTNNGPIPKKYTCQGRDTSVPLAWSNSPAGTKALALIMDDPDARPVVGYEWVHWVVYNIPGDARSLPEGLVKAASLTLSGGRVITQGLTSWKKPGYGGPCPPKGTGVHHYIFSLYALDTEPAFPPGLTKAGLLATMKGKILAQAKLTGTYTKD